MEGFVAYAHRLAARSPGWSACRRRASPSARRRRGASSTASPVDSVTWGEIVAAGAQGRPRRRAHRGAGTRLARDTRDDDPSARSMPCVRPGRPTAAAMACGVALVAAGARAGTARRLRHLPLDKLRVPAGFRVELLTDAVPNARQMALGRSADGKGVVYVGSASAGKVYAVADTRAGGRGTVHTVASGLQLPTGVAWRDGALFVAARRARAALRRHRRQARAPPAPVLVTDRLPVGDAPRPAASSPSAPTASSTCRSVRRATSACPTNATASSSA